MVLAPGVCRRQTRFMESRRPRQPRLVVALSGLRLDGPDFEPPIIAMELEKRRLSG